MKKIYLSFLALSLALGLHAQNEFYMQSGSSVTIQNNGLLYVKGELYGVGASFSSDGKVILSPGNVDAKLDWNSTANTFTTDSLTFTGTIALDGYITGNALVSVGTLQSDLYYEVGPSGENNARLYIDRDVTVTNKLRIDKGILETSGTYVIDVTNKAEDAVESTTGFGDSKSNYVIGRLRRAVEAGKTYQFPIGSELNGYNLAELNLSAVPGSATALTAYFQDSDLGSVNYLAGQYNCTSVGAAPNQQLLLDKTWENFGYWDIKSNGPSTGWNYDAKFHPNLSAVSFSGYDMVKMMKTTNNISGSYNWTSADVEHGFICDGANIDLSNSSAPFKYLGGTHAGNQSYVAMTGVTGFSSFGGGGSGSVGLPVELVTLKADPIENKFIRVSWTTATEINNAGFEVLRSEDGINFTNIGWVDGAGNSSTMLNYRFDDENVVANTVYYYRLRQVDYDGQSDLTNIVSAMITDNAVFVISEFMPNPTENTSSFTVVTSEVRDINLTVYNTLGQIITDSRFVAQPNQTNKYEVNLSEMASGTYYAIIATGPHTFNKKIVVSR